jgi:hypothetical protein
MTRVERSRPTQGVDTRVIKTEFPEAIADLAQGIEIATIYCTRPSRYQGRIVEASQATKDRRHLDERPR